MLLVQFRLRANHLRFDPQTELDSLPVGFLGQTGDAVGEFVGGHFPVAQRLRVAMAGIFVAEPTVIQQEHIHSEFFGLSHKRNHFDLFEI